MRYYRTPKLPKPYRPSVTKDRVDPKDFQNLNIIHCCEQCSHFDGEKIECSIGYDCKNHLRETNLENYRLSGRLAFCRYLEID